MQDDEILRLIDLTSLSETDNAQTITEFCNNILALSMPVAAVCIYPAFVSQVKNALAHTGIKIATVVNFPDGKDPLPSVLEAIDSAINAGANEIDMVFPYSTYLEGDKTGAFNFVESCKKVLSSRVILKIILETSQLRDSIIAEISAELCRLEVDFLKTSTGKKEGGATPAAARIILQTIKEINPEVGFKAAGGIRSRAQAEEYILLAQEIMGKEWVSPERFRIGTSKIFEA